MHEASTSFRAETEDRKAPHQTSTYPVESRWAATKGCRIEPPEAFPTNPPQSRCPFVQVRIEAFGALEHFVQHGDPAGETTVEVVRVEARHVLAAHARSLFLDERAGGDMLVLTIA